MRHTLLNTGLGMALGLTLTACDLTQIKKKADENTTQPATAATVVGIWRTDVVVPGTPPTDIKITMQVDAASTMVLSQRVATGQPSPYDYVEISKENWTWKVENGAMVSEKTTCEYKDPATMQPTGETACRAPLTRNAPINVKGTAWTVVQEGTPVVFRKD